jgi:hypothetical protein
MLGYIISDKKEINVFEHEIKSFDILHKTDLNIFVVKNNKVLYKNNIILNASRYQHIKILEWYKNSGYEIGSIFSAIFCASHSGNVEILNWVKSCVNKFKYRNKFVYWANKNAINFYVELMHIKKIIKWCNFKINIRTLKTIKFKTRNNYIKGYNKN